MGGPAPLPDLFASMLRIRRIEEAIAKRYPEGEMRCPVHFCIGQEAVPAAICAQLARTDRVFSGHRSHGHYLAKGGDLRAMLAELYGRETGCARGRGGSQHLIDLEAGFVASAPILAGTIPIAVGAALSATWRKSGSVSVVFFGDGATEEGAFHESMNFAAARRLPVLFVCENNAYSVHSAMEGRQPAGRRIADMAKAYAMASAHADGNDAAAVWNAGAIALDHVRKGNGPYLLEFDTYRWLEHCGPNPDDALGYRTPAEIDAWRRRCPIEKLRRDSVPGAAEERALEARIAAEIDAAFAAARAAPFPDPRDLGAFVHPARS
ncbi:MAG: thiamine pyrophosphate-dependent dehydrogenase E1 component subunit alpha [Rhodospirillales bacterium]|nr:thiamine pyrophosphate-dependent dehydrogenase E1 component subunit alpha [Rhodospirillales bacterium]